MPRPVKVLVVVAAYGAVITVGVVWMEWLKESMLPRKLQGGLFALWLFLGCGAANQTTRIGTKALSERESE